MSDFNEFPDSPVHLSTGAQLTYPFDTEDYGGSPTNITVTATNLTTNKTVTGQILSGSASVSGDVITLPTIQSLIEYNLYAVDVVFTCSSQVYKRRLKVQTEF